MDAVVLVRGGGSLEDLQSFNDEKLSRAIFSSKAPVVCGVGHEDDITIADLVSDLRASTPSNAAELLVRSRTEVMSEVNHTTKTIYNQLLNILKDNNNRVRKGMDLLDNAINKQASFIHRMIAKFANQFTLLRQEAVNSERSRFSYQIRLLRVSKIWINQHMLKLESLSRLLSSFDMQKVMTRGFSITFDDQGKILKSVEGASKGSQITTSLFDGKIGSQILDISKTK